jgi:hypothetical protein
VGAIALVPVIAPGDSTSLVVTAGFSDRREFAWTRSIILVTNDLRDPEQTITITADLQPELELQSPAATTARDVAAGSRVPWVIVLSNNGDSARTIEVPFVEEEHGVRVRFNKPMRHVVKPGSTVTLRGEVELIDASQMPASAKVRVSTSSPIDSEFPLTFWIVPKSKGADW